MEGAGPRGPFLGAKRQRGFRGGPRGGGGQGGVLACPAGGVARCPGEGGCREGAERPPPGGEDGGHSTRGSSVVVEDGGGSPSCAGHDSCSAGEGGEALGPRGSAGGPGGSGYRGEALRGTPEGGGRAQGHCRGGRLPPEHHEAEGLGCLPSPSQGHLRGYAAQGAAIPGGIVRGHCWRGAGCGGSFGYLAGRCSGKDLQGHRGRGLGDGCGLCSGSLGNGEEPRLGPPNCGLGRG